MCIYWKDFLISFFYLIFSLDASTIPLPFDDNEMELWEWSSGHYKIADCMLKCISMRFPWNSEASASEFQGNLVEMFFKIQYDDNATSN